MPDPGYQSEFITELMRRRGAAASADLSSSPSSPPSSPSSPSPSPSPSPDASDAAPPLRKLVRRQVRAEAAKIGCTQCAAPIDVRNLAMAEQVSCSYCGAVLDLTTPDRAVLRQLVTKERPRSALPLGAKGTLRGTAWEVIGRVRMVQRDEGVCHWDEYLLFSPEKGYAWLLEDQGHWTFMHKMKTKPTLDPRHVSYGLTFSAGGESFKVMERSVAGIEYIEGEFPYQAQRGDQSNFMDAVKPPLVCCAEWTATELEWLLGEYVLPEDVKAAFSVETLPEPVGVYICQPRPRSMTREECSWASGMFAAFFFVMLFVSWSLFGGSRLTSFTVNAADYLPRTGSPEAEPWTSDPIRVATPTVLQVSYRAPLDNSWIFLETELLDENKEPIHVFTNELSYYHGYEGGESWSEGSGSDYSMLRLDEAGTYYLSISGEGGQGEGTGNPRREPVDVTVYEEVCLQRWFFLAFLLCMILPLLEMTSAGRFEAARNADYAPDDDD